MKEDVRLNVRQVVSVFAQQLGIRELAYFRQLSCEGTTVQTQQRHELLTLEAYLVHS